MWDWSIGSLEMVSYAGVHPGWPLGRRRNPFMDSVYHIGSRLDKKARKKSRIAARRLIWHLPIDFADFDLPFGVILYKSPLDREEGPVGPCKASQFNLEINVSIAVLWFSYLFFSRITACGGTVSQVPNKNTLSMTIQVYIFLNCQVRRDCRVQPSS